MRDVTYTHGHHESVLRSHQWRTAENSAAYLVPHLRPGMSILDVGCGPGTVTVDLAGIVAPGRVVGIDAAESVLEVARSVPVAGGAAVSFEVGDVYHLEFEAGTFDVVHAHQVLQHLGDPVAALVEMRRVCKPGGIVAARDGDYPAMSYFPPDPMLDAALEHYQAAARANGGQPDAGRKMLHWAQAAGFADITPSASLWCFATPDDRAWWGGLWADRVTRSSLADQLLARGLATAEELDAFAGAWRAWAAAPDGWFITPHGEVLCRA